MAKIKKSYRTFPSYLKDRFGGPVRKISVDAGFTCPNRDGKRGLGGCLYCNASGSGPGKRQAQDLIPHIKTRMKSIRSRYPGTKFILYFQAFTNTYASLDRLKSLYDLVYTDDDIVSMSIGTRPDCVDLPILSLIDRYTEDKDIWVEYGVETTSDEDLEKINRLHTFEEVKQAMAWTKMFPRIKTCLHLIMGLPHQDRQTMIKSVKDLIPLGMNALKIHNLYIEKNTPLYAYYRKNPFPLLSFDDYAQILSESLEMLPPHVIVQRISGEASRGTLYAPEWGTDMPGVLQESLHQYLQKYNIQQGRKF